MANSGLSNIEHIVVLMLENRSFDHMLGFLYADRNNLSPLGHPFTGLTGNETNPDSNGNPVQVFKITPDTPNAYFMPGSDPGEGYYATNSQLFGDIHAPGAPPANSNQGFVTDYAYTLGLAVAGKRLENPAGHPGRQYHGLLYATGASGVIRTGNRLRRL
nr:alkaline phosphatase family protein [Dickeya dadantii]